MKGEIDKYNSLVKAIKLASERQDSKGKDTFKLLNFWRAHETAVPAFSYVLSAILANAPMNSIPPERVFSILNNTFGDDQDSALADYIELALQLQFNERSRVRKRRCDWGAGVGFGSVSGRELGSQGEYMYQCIGPQPLQVLIIY